MSLAEFHTIADCRSSRWLLAHFDYPHKDFCLIWPFARKGGGYVQISRGILVHRLICEYRNGPPPSPEHHAAHSCGRGHDGCVNQWHLNWRTPSENQLERFEQSGITPRHKITFKIAEQIRQLQGTATADAVALQFEISESNVRLIWAGKIWKAQSVRVFTEQEVAYVRSTRKDKPARVLADEFSVGRSVIERIREGKTYRYFPAISHPPGNIEPGA